MALRQSKGLFRIADFEICITFKDTTHNSISLLPSFGKFAMTEDDGMDIHFRLFSLTVDDGIKAEKGCRPTRNVDTGNGHTAVFLRPDGGYQYIISDSRHRCCCLLQTDSTFRHCRCALNGNRNMRTFGLSNALMLLFAFAGSHHGTLLIHASAVMHKGHAHPFIALSGTGKSTHSALWTEHIPNTELLNDDSPIIRIKENGIFLYGSPWSGKTPCYRNIKAPLCAITKIERDTHNSIERLSPAKAIAALLPSCPSMKWDKTIYNNTINMLTKIIETTPVYTLHCLPDKEAALLCHKTITNECYKPEE